MAKQVGVCAVGMMRLIFFWYYIYKHKHWTDVNVIVGTQIHTHASFFNFTITPLFHFQHLIYHHPLSHLLQFQRPKRKKKLFFRIPFCFFYRKVELQKGYLYDLFSGFFCSSLVRFLSFFLNCFGLGLIFVLWGLYRKFDFFFKLCFCCSA